MDIKAGHDDGHAPQAGAEPSRGGRRRVGLAVAAVVTVALGLGIRAFVDAEWAGPTGDALYAVLVYLVVAFVMPPRPRWVAAVVAWVLCMAIELFQATGIPAELAQQWPPIRLLLGTTFVPLDLLAYTVGVGLAFLVDRLVSSSESSRSDV